MSVPSDSITNFLNQEIENLLIEPHFPLRHYSAPNSTPISSQKVATNSTPISLDTPSKPVSTIEICSTPLSSQTDSARSTLIPLTPSTPVSEIKICKTPLSDRTNSVVTPNSEALQTHLFFPKPIQSRKVSSKKQKKIPHALSSDAWRQIKLDEMKVKQEIEEKKEEKKKLAVEKQRKKIAKQEEQKAKKQEKLAQNNLKRKQQSSQQKENRAKKPKKNCRPKIKVED